MTESDADFEMLESRLSQLTPDERILVGQRGRSACSMAGDSTARRGGGQGRGLVAGGASL